MNDLARVGRLAAEQQDSLADRVADLDGVRRRFLEAGVVPRSRHRRAVWLAAAIIAVVAGVAILVLRAGREPSPLTFRVGEKGTTGEVGAWLASSAEAALPLGFSDGTSVVLEPSARARVTKIGRVGGTILVESGRARISVVKRKDAAWQVSLGPFRVDVTGTRFDVDWDPRAEKISLDMHEGSVLVSGCLFGAGRPFVAGESMRASCRDGHVEITTAPGATSTHHAPARAPADEGSMNAASGISRALPEGHSRPDPSAVTNARGAPPAPLGWRELVRGGRHGEALDTAESMGFSGECAAASAADLVALGDAARYVGRLERATEAYQTARRRFPGHERSAVAAFALGRIAFDQRANYAEATRWFRAYLEEQPGGRLARDALGRLMESLQRVGEVAAARREAGRYLELYPAGPHAEFARRLTSE